MPRRLLALIALLLGSLSVVIGQSAADDSDIKALKKAQLPTDGPGLIEYFRQRTIGEADKSKLQALIRKLGDPVYSVRDAATKDLIAAGLPALGLLRQATSDPDVEIARRAERCLQSIEKVPGGTASIAGARVLAELKTPGAVPALLNYLPYADDENVADELREALFTLSTANGRPDDDLLKALDDGHPIRRGAAGEALLRAHSDAARRLLTDPDADVRLRAHLAAIMYGKDKAALPGLISLLAEPPPLPAWKAEELLSRLAGDTAPSVALGKTPEARQKCRDAWNEWWNSNIAKVDLARLESVPRQLGLTLIVQNDQRNVTGKVYEVNPDGEIQWKIDNIQAPFDAIVVGKDRVLIIEEGGLQIRLHDFQGNTLWTKQMQSASHLQPLPQGHVLIAARNQLTEWNAKRENVFHLQRERFDLAAAVKDKSGDYLLLTTGGTIIRVNNQKKELKSFAGVPARFYFAGMDVAPNGNIIITHPNGVTEFNPDGVKVWEKSVSGQPTSVQRLPSGNTLIAGLQDRSVIEVDRQKKVVWEYKPADGAMPKKARRR